MKEPFMKCTYCKVDIGGKSEKCVFAMHKRIINGVEYTFCCENHADNFQKEKKKKRQK